MNELQASSPRPIIVVGMHRSGTSACTLALHKLGLFLGPEGDLKGGDEFNEDGYWETRPLMDKGFELLAEFDNGFSMNSSLPEDWSGRAEYQPHLDDLANFLPKYFEGHEFFGWKDPRMALLLPVYKEVFRRIGWRPRYVVPVRNPLDVASSLHRRDSMPEAIAMGLWVHYVLCSLRAVEGEDAVLVRYDALLENPRSVLEPIFAGFPVSPTEDAWGAVRRAIAPERSHSSRAIEELAGPEMDFARRVYEVAWSAAGDSAGFRLGAYRERIESLWWEWSRMGELRSGNWQQGFLHFGWRNRTGEQRSASKRFVANQGWTSLKVTLSDHASDRLVLGVSPFPAVIQLRHCWFTSGDGSRLAAQPSPGSQSYFKPSEGGARVLAFGNGDHVGFAMPEASGDLDFECEFSVEVSYRAARAAALALASEVLALRQQIRGGYAGSGFSAAR